MVRCATSHFAVIKLEVKLDTLSQQIALLEIEAESMKQELKDLINAKI